MKEYEVTVLVAPQTLTVFARSVDEAQRKAVLMIGLAGFQAAAAFDTHPLLATPSPPTP